VQQSGKNPATFQRESCNNPAGIRQLSGRSPATFRQKTGVDFSLGFWRQGVVSALRWNPFLPVRQRYSFRVMEALFSAEDARDFVGTLNLVETSVGDFIEMLAVPRESGGAMDTESFRRCGLGVTFGAEFDEFVASFGRVHRLVEWLNMFVIFVTGWLSHARVQVAA
jgi:hypothetical protein